MASVSRFLQEQLRLKVNEAKSAVEGPWKRKFLGCSLTSQVRAKLEVAPESVRRLRAKVKERFRAGRGRNLGQFIREDLNPLLRGWANYFGLAEGKGVFAELDGWGRRRLRCVQWRQWKRGKPR